MKKIILFLFVSIFLISMVSAQTNEVILASFTDGNPSVLDINSFFSRNERTQIGMRFSIENKSTIKSVNLVLARLGTIGKVEVFIKKVVGGFPVGEILSSGDFDGDSIILLPAFPPQNLNEKINIDMTDKILEPGTYAILTNTPEVNESPSFPGPGATGNYLMYPTVSNAIYPYDEGSLLYFNTIQEEWIFVNQNIHFEILGTVGGGISSFIPIIIVIAVIGGLGFLFFKGGKKGKRK